MIFQRLIWSALATALLVGSLQTGVQRWQVAPLILDAEVVEAQKAEAQNAETPKAEALRSDTPAATHMHAQGEAPHTHETAHETARESEAAHDHGAAKEWEPENGVERIGWTWVANVLHAFSMALLVFAVMGAWLYQWSKRVANSERGEQVGRVERVERVDFDGRVERRAVPVRSMRLAGLVALAGWLSFHLWPSLGLPAEVPGMEAAPLHARQLWWVLAVVSALAACAVAGFARGYWRWLLSAAMLALPFVVGAPHLQGDALAGFGPEARAELAILGQQFIWATTWVAMSFWLSMGVACGLAFERWLRAPVLAILEHPAASNGPAMEAPQ